jgi:hypothetical protein
VLIGKLIVASCLQEQRTCFFFCELRNKGHVSMSTEGEVLAGKEKVANWGKSCPAPACSISGSVLVSLFWFVLHPVIVHIHLIVTFSIVGCKSF